MSTIYLDSNATTAACQEALTVLRDLSPLPLNPSSTHQLGRAASSFFRGALEGFSSFLANRPEDILITSSATEAINTYLWHLSQTQPLGRIISCVTEHAAVLKPLERLQKLGWKVELMRVDTQGHIDLTQLEKELKQGDVRLLVFMAANNETGVLHPIEALAELAMRYDTKLLVDAVAAVGKYPIQHIPGVTAMALSAHKFHGPAGVGILSHQPNMRLHPWIVGGGQQLGKRSGTLNIVNVFAAWIALQSYQEKAPQIFQYLLEIRDYFETQLIQRLGAKVNGGGERAPNVSNLYFPGVDGEALLIQLDQAGVMASHGSACQAGAMELSHVLLAMHGRERTSASVRFSFSRFNTKQEIEEAVQIIAKAVQDQAGS